jgi:hypothetical protein
MSNHHHRILPHCGFVPGSVSSHAAKFQTILTGDRAIKLSRDGGAGAPFHRSVTKD